MSPTLDDEVSFISGVDSTGKVVGTSYNDWTFDNPATYAANSEEGKWGTGTAGTASGTVYYYFDPASNWQRAEQTVFEESLALWSAVANITFVQGSSAAGAITLTRGNDQSAYTYTHFDDTTDASAGEVGSSKLYTIDTTTVKIDTSAVDVGFGPIDGNFATAGGYVWMAVVHELGHAIGLGHGGAYNSTVNSAVQQYSPYDTLLSSLMSYINPKTSTHAIYYGNILSAA